MKKFSFAFGLIIGLGAGCCCTGGNKQQAKLLFNGRDIAGWEVMYGGEWTVEDAALVGRNGKDWSTEPEKSGSWLRAKKQYSDFFLELDYSINQGGNSGIFICSGLEKNPAFTGHEMQIVADSGRPPAKGSAGSLYDVIAASKNMSKPAGEWELTVRRDSVLERGGKRSATPLWILQTGRA